MSASPTWSAVLFDLDGTLADTVGLILRCYRHTMSAHRGGPLPDERWLATIGRPLRDQLLDFAEDEEEAAAMLETYVAFQRTVHDDMVRPYPGAVEVLDELRGGGTRLGVVTSKRREMAERTLSCCGFLDRFDVLIGADDVSAGKPDPEPVLAALERLGDADPGRTLFVGDSPFDVIAGREAGVRTAAALWGPFPREVLEEAGPDYFVRTIAEIRTLSPGEGS